MTILLSSTAYSSTGSNSNPNSLKLFNKALDLEGCYFREQHRRKLCQRAAYHGDGLDLDLVAPNSLLSSRSRATMTSCASSGSLGSSSTKSSTSSTTTSTSTSSTSSTTTKSSISNSNSNNSPVCVTDVKQFEPALFYGRGNAVADADVNVNVNVNVDVDQNDAGGVAIDLCLSDDEDDINDININNISNSISNDFDSFDCPDQDDDSDLADLSLLGLEFELEEPPERDCEEQQQHQQQQQQQHHQQQQQQQPQRRQRPALLAPILEERKVVFAAKHVVLRVNDDLDSSRHSNCSSINSNGSSSNSNSERYVHQVFDAVQVWFIPHHTEYDLQEKSGIWYSAFEMACMKEDAARAKMAHRCSLTLASATATATNTSNSNSNSSSNNNNKQTPRDSEHQHADPDTCAFSPLAVLRGAKTTRNHAGTGARQRQPQPQQPEDEECRHTNQHHHQQQQQSYHSSRRERYEAVIDAVLLEQYEQRLMCYRVYGRVDPNGGGIIDPDRLAEIYSIVGDTQESHQRAVDKARRFLERVDGNDGDSDADADSYGDSYGSNEETSTVSTTATASDHAASVRGTKKQSSPRLPSKPPANSTSPSSNSLKRSPSFNSSTNLNAKLMAFETSHCLERGVNSVLETLLKPFLEIRSGDLFLGIGEEMSI
eukprot:CAMPEP_0168222704 /NCGR_PEP_ID=MMETSP0140_2-20121125/10824_1 /TAXON_ID=44445 /ORGANISM="Pseudo-nitzschia australis, Strain 10249 10 AB" /LENGTH=655 /DNA_ID=CAMNT_0008152347 /DNA_START=276 /DNA_END=2243 /DNA_ORIENTATION=-